MLGFSVPIKVTLVSLDLFRRSFLHFVFQFSSDHNVVGHDIGLMFAQQLNRIRPQPIVCTQKKHILGVDFIEHVLEIVDRSQCFFTKEVFHLRVQIFQVSAIMRAIVNKVDLLWKRRLAEDRFNAVRCKMAVFVRSNDDREHRLFFETGSFKSSESLHPIREVRKIYIFKQ